MRDERERRKTLVISRRRGRKSQRGGKNHFQRSYKLLQATEKCSSFSCSSIRCPSFSIHVSSCFSVSIHFSSFCCVVVDVRDVSLLRNTFYHSFCMNFEAHQRKEKMTIEAKRPLTPFYEGVEEGALMLPPREGHRAKRPKR